MVDGTRLESMDADAVLSRSLNPAGRTGAGRDTVVAARVNEAGSIVACRLI